MLSIGILAAFAAALFWGISQLISKVIAPRIGTYRTAALVVSAGILPMLIIFLIFPTTLTLYNILISVGAGVALAAGYILFYKSVESQNISNIGGIDLLQPAVLVIFGIFILSEPINAVQILGTLIVFVGIALISEKRNGKFNRKLLPAALGNISWAFYWVILSYAISSSSQYVLPLLISRTTAAIITVFALMFLIETKSGDKFRQSKKTSAIKLSLAVLIILGVTEAIFDSSGNIVFGIVISNNVIALGAVLTALEPAFIAFCAHFIFKERLNKVQTLGLAAAIAGALLIALF